MKYVIVHQPKDAKFYCPNDTVVYVDETYKELHETIRNIMELGDTILSIILQD